MFVLESGVRLWEVNNAVFVLAGALVECTLLKRILHLWEIKEIKCLLRRGVCLWQLNNAAFFMWLGPCRSVCLEECSIWLEVKTTVFVYGREHD